MEILLSFLGSKSLLESLFDTCLTVRHWYKWYRVSHSLPNPAFFSNSNPNEDIATEFEQEYVRCVRNENECVCSVCL